MTVNQCLVEGRWTNHNISFDLPDEIITACSGMIKACEREDFWFSSLTVDGKFNFSKAMETVQLYENTNLDPDPGKWVWKVKAPPKITFFLWLVVADRLPHNALLWSRKIIQSNMCQWCPGQSEDSDHILRTCCKAREVWDLACPQLDSAFFDEPFNVWLKRNATVQYPANTITLPWGQLFIFILWSLWLRRNASIFSQQHKHANS